jgi:hypothetical protein
MTPMNNPTVSLSMSLDTFNDIQRILAARPFEDVADMILTLKHQVQTQLEQFAREQATQASGPRLVPDSEAG